MITVEDLPSIQVRFGGVECEGLAHLSVV